MSRILPNIQSKIKKGPQAKPPTTLVENVVYAVHTTTLFSLKPGSKVISSFPFPKQQTAQAEQSNRSRFRDKVDVGINGVIAGLV